MCKFPRSWQYKHSYSIGLLAESFWVDLWVSRQIILRIWDSLWAGKRRNNECFEYKSSGLNHKKREKWYLQFILQANKRSQSYKQNSFYLWAYQRSASPMLSQLRSYDSLMLPAIQIEQRLLQSNKIYWYNSRRREKWKCEKDLWNCFGEYWYLERNRRPRVVGRLDWTEEYRLESRSWVIGLVLWMIW